MKRLARLSVIGASIVSAGFLTAGMGVASADAIIDTGPGSYNAILTRSHFNQTVHNTNNVRLSNQNYQRAVTGSATVSNNTNGGNNNRCNYGHQTSYVPTSYIKHMRKKHVMAPSHYAVMPNRGYDHASYAPGYGGINVGGQSGIAATGNASNYNATQASVDIANSTPALNNVGTNVGGNSTISDTGPHSFNLISSTSTNNTEVTNNNNVNIANTNMQTAVSGNATVSGNTRGGSATTGNATNTNSTDIEVAITNN